MHGKLIKILCSEWTRTQNIVIGYTDTKRKNEANCSSVLQYSVLYQVILSTKDAIEI